MKTIKFFSLGCKVNQYDTQSIRERFLQNGYHEVTNGVPADVYLIDTCTVTSNADAKSRNIIRRCINENPGAKVIVTGCLAEKDAQALIKIKGIDFIISKRFFPQGISRFSGRTRAFLKIQDGCNNFCSYCKVPLVRGRSRSRNLREVVAEARALSENGFKEIVLTGICLGAYGRDLEPVVNLPDLILALEEIEGLLRIRLSSIEALDISPDLISKISGSAKVCRHLHIPLQSGDNDILAKMNRKYSREYFLSLVKHIKKDIPDASITTDILVGFPGEKDYNFQNTVEAVKEILPLKAHVFPYSQREGTSAINFTDKIGQAKIRERILRMRDVSCESSYIYRSQFVGKALDVLFEEKEKDCFWVGFTSNYIKVRINSKEDLGNRLIPLKINKILPDLALAAS